MLSYFLRHIVFWACYGLLMAFAVILHGCKNQASNKPTTDTDLAKVQQPSTPFAQVPDTNSLQAGGGGAAVLFSLEPVTLQAGTSGCVNLKAVGAAEGYFIKSIAIYTDPSTTTDYKANFGLNAASVDLLKKQPITAAGLNIQLTPSLRLKPQGYTLIIKVSKVGIGSTPTHQFVCSKLTLLGGESVEQDHPSNTTKVEQKRGSVPAPAPISTPVPALVSTPVPDIVLTPVPVSFTLENINLPPGSSGCVSLKAVGVAEGYFIRSIAIYTDPPTTTDHKKKFGWDKSNMETLKKQPITAAGLNIELKPGLRHKSLLYTLTINIGKVGKGSRSTYQSVFGKVMITDHTVDRTPNSEGVD